VENFFLGESIGIDQNNTLQLKLLFYHPNCRSHSFGRFVGVRVGVAPCWDKLALRKKLKNPHPNSLAFIVSEISAFIRTERQTDRRT